MKITLPTGGELHVEHPRLTPMDLIKLSKAGEVVERSDHVGNQHIAALSTITDPRMSVRQILVDTIHGKDIEYSPRRLHILGKTILLAKNASSDTNVRHLKSGTLPAGEVALLERLLGNSPEPGTDISQLHKKSLKKVAGGKTSVVFLSELVRNNTDTARTLFHNLDDRDLLRRTVLPNGSIVGASKSDLNRTGIFGELDEIGQNSGMLLPLEGMMALDLVLATQVGVDVLYHQAGCDMKRYTKNEDLMSIVGEMAVQTLLQMGHPATLPVYRIIDTSNVETLFTKASRAMLPGSQYDESLRLSSGCSPLKFTDDMLNQPLYT